MYSSIKIAINRHIIHRVDLVRVPIAIRKNYGQNIIII